MLGQIEVLEVLVLGLSNRQKVIFRSDVGDPFTWLADIFWGLLVIKISARMFRTSFVTMGGSHCICLQSA